MISGAFILSNSRTENIVSFYKHVSYKIFLPTGVILLLLLCFRIGYTSILRYGVDSFISLAVSIVNGSFYNFWYMYMLLFIYLCAPFIVIIRGRISLKLYTILSIALLLWAIISQATSSQSISWNIGVVISYTSYFIAGDVIKIHIDKGHIKKKHIPFLAVLAMVCVACSLLFRIYVSNYYSYKAYVAFLSPTVAVMSICFFVLFGLLSIKRDFTRISSLTFYVYLFHTVILSACHKTIIRFLDAGVLTALLEFSCASLVSFGVSFVFKKVWDSVTVKHMFEQKWDSMKIWTKL